MKFLFFATICCFIIAKAASEDEPNICLDAVYNITQRQVEHIHACASSLGHNNSEEINKHRVCILKCSAVRDELFAPDGKVTKEVAEAFMKKNMPSYTLSTAIPMLNNCVDVALGTDGEIPADPNEASCESYNPFLKCYGIFVSMICDSVEPA